MNSLTRVWNSSIGKKYLMAVSGGVLFVFVIGHLLGNLQIFLKPAAINRYGHFLQSNPEILWTARLGLLAMVVLHIVSAIRLTAGNRAARGPVGYACVKPNSATYASRTMMISGLIVLAFIVYHLLHYTVLVPGLNFAGVDFRALKEPGTGYHDVYAMVIHGFRQPLVSLFYVIAVALLCLHLSHGIQAMFQSLGLKNAVYAPLLVKFSRVAALIIFVGYVSIPVAVLLGHGKEYVQSATRTARVNWVDPQPPN